MIRSSCAVERSSHARLSSRLRIWCGLGRLEASYPRRPMCRTRARVRLCDGALNPPEAPEGPTCSNVVPMAAAMRVSWILETQELFPWAWCHYTSLSPLQSLQAAELKTCY